MTIVFRVDASIAMGTGHVMRCRTLAFALKKYDEQIQFITRAHPGHLGDMLACDGFAVTLLPLPACFDNNGNDYANWLGVSQQEDAEQTIAALENQQCDWLIVDHYGLDRFWELRLQSRTHKLMVIDDLADRPHACNVLLDQNYAVASEARYLSWVNAHCQILVGPRYALLHPEYAKYRETMPPRTRNIKRILVSMGGADNANITGKVLSALSAVQLASLEVDVVIGPNFSYKSEVIEQANARPNTHVYDRCPHLASLMAEADLAVGAGGATTWERLCMGLPSLVLSTAKNQEPGCDALASVGLIQYIGDANKVDAASITSALLDSLAEVGHLRAMETCYKALVDGRGTDRIVEQIYPTHVTELTVRSANVNDVLTYFSWVNDPVVRSSATNPEPIDIVTHLEWFNHRLSDPKSQLYVLEAGGLPVGQVRFEWSDIETTIDYSLDVLVRGRGWAKKLIKLGIEVLDVCRPTILSATVKSENTASVATFIRLGFYENIIANTSGNRYFQLPFSGHQKALRQGVEVLNG